MSSCLSRGTGGDRDPRRWEKRETVPRRTQATVEQCGRLNSLKSIGTGGGRNPGGGGRGRLWL